MKTGDLTVYLAGTPWHGVAGTDHALVTALAERGDVLWVDPPESALSWILPGRISGTPAPGLATVAPGIRRLRLPGPPAVTRRGIRSLTAYATNAVVRFCLARLDVPVLGTVVANPLARARGLPGPVIVYVTDDWVAGAPMMGLDPDHVDRVLRANLAHADVVGAVSPLLLRTLHKSYGSRRGLVLPNGCRPIEPADHAPRPDDVPEEPFAVMVGQLNERIDTGVLRSVVDHGVPLVLIGPRSERTPAQREALDALIAHPNVTWLGRRPQDDLAPYLGAARVGLTPYAMDAFNQASFPLKSLEYLSAGLPVISTDLPASHWLDTDLVAIADDPDHFAELTSRAVRCGDGVEARTTRREFASRHSWGVRAQTLREAIASADCSHNQTAVPSGA